MLTARQLQNLYNKGENVTAALRDAEGAGSNTEKMIEIAYDLQSGSYIAAFEKPDHAAYAKKYTAEIARMITSLCSPQSIMEAGIGEATTLCGVVQNLNIADLKSYGFDISWSRVACGTNWLRKNKVKNVTLCTGSLFNIPFLDRSIDVVYTSHSIEPNGGQEEAILKELYRVTRKYLILLEPGYELASPEAKKRMESHGYCKNLPGIARSLGYKVLDHAMFPVYANPLNPTAITVIEKNADGEQADNPLCCPVYKTPLKEIEGTLYSPEGLVAYPVLGGIPCLRAENGILASKYPEYCNASDID